MRIETAVFSLMLEISIGSLEVEALQPVKKHTHEIRNMDIHKMDFLLEKNMMIITPCEFICAHYIRNMGEC